MLHLVAHLRTERCSLYTVMWAQQRTWKCFRCFPHYTLIGAAWYPPPMWYPSQWFHWTFSIYSIHHFHLNNSVVDRSMEKRYIYVCIYTMLSSGHFFKTTQCQYFIWHYSVIIIICCCLVVQLFGIMLPTGSHCLIFACYSICFYIHYGFVRICLFKVKHKHFCIVWYTFIFFCVDIYFLVIKTSKDL